MGNIISSELYNLHKNKTVKVVIGIYVFCAAAVIAFYLIGGVIMNSVSTKNLSAFGCFAGFPVGILYTLPLAVVVGNIIAGDYVQGIAKQIVSVGISRNKIIVGQYIAISMYMIVVSLVIGALKGIAIGAIAGKFDGVSPGRFVLQLIGLIAYTFFYTSIAFLITHLTRSAVWAVVINAILLSMSDIAVAVIIFTTKMDWLGDYWITTIASVAVNYGVKAADQAGSIAAIAVLSAVFVSITSYVYSKRDIS